MSDARPHDDDEVRRELAALASAPVPPEATAPGPDRTDELPATAVGSPVTQVEHVDRVGHLDHVEHAAPPTSRRRRRRWPARLAVGAVVVIVAAIAYYGVSVYQVWSTGRADQARQVDAIVVMGAAQYDGTPSPQLAARLDQVVRLWPAGHAPLVVVTGGNQPGDRFTEAEASAAYLAERGVPAEAIVQESSGTTTYESLEGVAALLDARGLRSILIVTDPYHALRSRMIAEEVGLEAYVSPTTTSVVTGGASVRRHLREALGVALARPLGFDRLRGLAG